MKKRWPEAKVIAPPNWVRCVVAVFVRERFCGNEGFRKVGEQIMTLPPEIAVEDKESFPRNLQHHPSVKPQVPLSNVEEKYKVVSVLLPIQRSTKKPIKVF